MSLDLRAARAEALFTSTLPTGESDPYVLKSAVICSIRAHKGVKGCACEMAEAYGTNMSWAVWRMAWARDAALLLGGPQKARTR